MRAVLTLVCLLLVTLTLVACPKRWPDQPWSEQVEAELSYIPAKRPPSAVFADFRSAYDDDPAKWDADAVQTLLEFEPKDEWAAEEFLGFVCFLSDKGAQQCEDYLGTVTVAVPNAGPYPFMEIASKQEFPVGEFFDHFHVKLLDSDDEGDFIIGLKEGPRS